MSSILPFVLHGPEPSYFTGKLDAVLRYKELPFTRVPTPPHRKLHEAAGVAQVPALELADGRFTTDSTPIIAWLEREFPEPPVIPRDPELAFVSKLVEDYADEWLWRPAMHYRWSYDQDAYHLSRALIDEAAPDAKLPGWLMRWRCRRRQHGWFVKRDGVTAETWDHVESCYLRVLAQMESMLETRPYLLGERPTLVDFGMFGPMFRHFGQDPTPSRIMRDTAPRVFEWVARVWNARGSRDAGTVLATIPDDWGPLLDLVGTGHLEQLNANAEAHEAGAAFFDMTIEGVRYRKIRTAPYRVWCLEELRREFGELGEEAQQRVRTLLDKHGCWEPLWRVQDIASGLDPDRQVPFAGGASQTGLKHLI